MIAFMFVKLLSCREMVKETSVGNGDTKQQALFLILLSSFPEYEKPGFYLPSMRLENPTVRNRRVQEKIPTDSNFERIPNEVVEAASHYSEDIS